MRLSFASAILIETVSTSVVRAKVARPEIAAQKTVVTQSHSHG